MSKLKRLAPRQCPDCNAEHSLFIDLDRKMTCRLCGYKDKKGDMSATVKPLSADARRENLTASYSMSNTAKIDRWAETKFMSGMQYVREKRWDDALEAFKAAVSHQRDFVDAHLWIARVSLDPQEQRNHLGEVVAYMPNNLEAKRELMVLNGEMTREQADRAKDMSKERDIQYADMAVGTELIEIACSNCHGTLEVPHGINQVTCKFCGHLERIAKNAVAMSSLTTAMIKERGQGTTWRVGKYLLHCDNCGAERVITNRKMNVECPFCGSSHVIKTDALQSFRQPDGIIPFRIKPDLARESLDGALNSFTEKLKGIFVNNRADKIRIEPVYLPYWVFDVMVHVTVRKMDNTSKRTIQQINQANQTQEFGDSLNNLGYCAVKSPPQRLTSRLERFDFSVARPYDAKLLANFTAEFYSIDYQQASLDIRGEVREQVRFRNGHNPHGDFPTLVSHMIQNMTFSLMMVPVWVATITEEDDDVRLGLIHGQTGQTILGKAVKAQA